jgi:hypothetical protein
MTAQHLRDLTGPRRHAVLWASIIKLESMLTDTTLSMSTSSWCPHPVSAEAKIPEGVTGC